MGIRKKSTDRKAEIVAAMLVLVTELGPDRVTTQAVANRVGITQAGVFRHFPTKRDLWHAVADWVVAEAQRRWTAAYTNNDCPLNSIKRVIGAQLKFIHDTPAVHSLIFSRELHIQNEELRQAFYCMATKFQDLLIDLVRQSQVNGVLPNEPPPKMIASLLLTFSPGLATQWSLSGRAFNLVLEGERLLAIMLDCLNPTDCQSREDGHDQA